MLRRCENLKTVDSLNFPTSIPHHILIWRIAITFWGFEGLFILFTPPNGIEVSLPDVTPEVCSAILPVAIVPEEEQLLTGGNDGGNPVGFRISFHSHLQFHPRSKSILQTCVHLNMEMLLTTRKTSNEYVFGQHYLRLIILSTKCNKIFSREIWEISVLTHRSDPNKTGTKQCCSVPSTLKEL